MTLFKSRKQRWLTHVNTLWLFRPLSQNLSVYRCPGVRGDLVPEGSTRESPGATGDLNSVLTRGTGRDPAAGPAVEEGPLTEGLTSSRGGVTVQL